MQCFAQCGFSRQHVFENANLSQIMREEDDEVKDCMVMLTSIFSAAAEQSAGAKRLYIVEDKEDEVDCNPVLYDPKSNTCCFFMCDIPVCQIR